MFRTKLKDGTTRLDGGSLTLLTAINIFYPINSIIMTTDNVNPETRLPGTTWIAWGAGRAVVGVGNNGTNTYTAEQTFGADTCTLTAAQSGVNAHAHSPPATFHVLAGIESGVSENNGNSLAQGPTTGRWEHNVTITGTSVSGAVSGASSPTAHDIRMSSIATYIWKRST